MFTKEERLFIWKKVYEFRSDEKVRIYFPGIGGEDKYGHRTRGNKNVLWVVWSS